MAKVLQPMLQGLQLWRLHDHHPGSSRFPSGRLKGWLETVGSSLSGSIWSVVRGTCCEELQSFSPAQCYRAATSDGNDAIFLISEDEEKKLAAEGEGRLRKDKQLRLSASGVLGRAESETKRNQLRCFMKSAPWSPSRSDTRICGLCKRVLSAWAIVISLWAALQGGRGDLKDISHVLVRNM